MSNKKPTTKRGLGRGFSSLIPTELLDESFDPTASQDEKVSDLRHISLAQITPDPDQPRREFDESALQGLAESIKEHGVLQPIVVVAKDDGYQIVAGERRYRAAKQAGITKIPALVRTVNGQHKLELSLIENLQRKDLNPLETATAYLKLRDQFNMTLEQIGQRMGALSVSTISNKLRLLRLDQRVKDALAKGDISEGQARPLIGLDVALVPDLLAKIIEESWSARKIEQYIVQLRAGGVTTPAKKRTVALDMHKNRVAVLAKRFDTKVKIRSTERGSGQISIAFKSEDDLQRIQDLLLN